jgi:predicted PhzF superfamily epimerase YddE/YHI9
MASGHVVLYFLEENQEEVTFESAKYTLKVREEGDYLAMKLPSAGSEPAAAPGELVRGLGKKPAEVYKSDDYLVVYQAARDVAELEPDFKILSQLECRGIIVTAPGVNSDFVSRFFAPSIGINEDPVTGSAHTKLVPYWSQRLDKKELHAEQLSDRGGKMICRDLGEHVELLGNARVYLQGHINTK